MVRGKCGGYFCGGATIKCHSHYLVKAEDAIFYELWSKICAVLSFKGGQEVKH